MSEQNGSTTEAAKTVARSVAELGHDAVTLAELQAELFKTELLQELRSMLVPVGMFILAVCLVLGCVPVFLISLAYVLIETAEMSTALAMLIAGGVGALAAVAVALTGRQLLRKRAISLARSREELGRNLQWIKQVLKHKSNPPRSSCPAGKGSTAIRM